jgi:hypothetical protein
MNLNDGYDWRFAAESHDGAVELDEYYELQFGESQ